MIYVIARLEVLPGTQSAVKRAALALIDATEKEEGCISYDLHVDVRKSNNLVFVERWDNREALEEHFKTDHIASFSETVKPYIVGQEIQVIDPRHVEIN